MARTRLVVARGGRGVEPRHVQMRSIPRLALRRPARGVERSRAQRQTQSGTQRANDFMLEVEQGSVGAVGRDEAPTTGELPSQVSSTSGRHTQFAIGVVLAIGLLVTQDVLYPLIAQASEAAPEGTFELILKTTDALGPLGGVFFLLSVVLCECIPLFPTTPLSLASGILFGPQQGALLVLGGTTIASIVAFSVSRGFGRPIAERIISAEMASHDEEDGTSLIQQKLQEIEAVIERGSFWQQAGSVLAMRLTPVIPFSASNYLLGLTPLPIAPYLTGTLVGMSFWSVVYASLGGASRAVLRAGVDPDQLLAELLETTGSVTSKAGVAALLGAVIAGAVFFGKGMLVDKEPAKQPASGSKAAPTGRHDALAEDEDASIVSKLHLPAADVGFYGEKLEQ